MLGGSSSSGAFLFFFFGWAFLWSLWAQASPPPTLDPILEGEGFSGASVPLNALLEVLDAFLSRMEVELGRLHHHGPSFPHGPRGCNSPDSKDDSSASTATQKKASVAALITLVWKT